MLATQQMALPGYLEVMRTPLVDGRVQVPGYDDTTTLKRLISETAKLSFHEVSSMVPADQIASKTNRMERGAVPIGATIVVARWERALDPERLQQILWNLVSNAVKFTNKGGKVQVRLERVNSHVEVAVSDTGVGIAEDVG